jgi:drug/metabolite transporter (DMT)-like permease
LELTPEEQAVADEFGPRPPPVNRAWIVLIATVIFLVVLLLANRAVVGTHSPSRNSLAGVILANAGLMVVGTLGYSLLDRFLRGASLGIYVAAIYGGPILAFAMDWVIVAQWETAGH